MPRILVVDDQRENLGIISKTLENYFADCTVIESIDATSALTIALDPESNLDLIITDVKMPEVSGFEFCQAYRERWPQAHVPVLMISGVFTESVDRARGLDSGADGYLSKPYRLSELVAQVKVLLRIKATEDRLRTNETLLEAELASRGGALVASENRFETLFESTPGAIWVVDTSQNLLDANPRGCALVNLTRQQIHRTHLPSMLPAAAAEVLQQHVPLWRAGETGTCEIQLPSSEHAQELVDLLISVHPIDYGGHEALIMHLHDITEHKRQERRERSSQTLEAIGRLAGGIAHDFNNLLTSILGFGHLVRDELAEGTEGRADAERIIQAAETACGLTRKLMVFGQRQILPLHPMDLNRSIAEATPMLRRTIGEHIELVPLLGDNLPFIESDEQLVEHLLTDLVTNARDAISRNGGKIIIQSRRVEIDEARARVLHVDARCTNYSVLSVTDDGRGIPDHIRDDIFEPFFTTKTDQTRTIGLGLSTAYGILKKASGFITLDSVEGSGTTVHAWFPACEGTPAGPAATANRPGGSETILVVEDEEHVLRLCVRLLDRLGYHVLQARNGTEALRVSNDHSGEINLLLTDVVMPYMGGPELAKAMELTRNHCKVLYTSGYTANPLPFSEGDKEIPFLMKPYTSDTLARKVREVLG